MRDRNVLGLIALAVYATAMIAALLPDRDRNGPRNPEPDPAGTYPACPHCGGGPVVALIGGAWACRSCARIIRRTT